MRFDKIEENKEWFERFIREVVKHERRKTEKGIESVHLKLDRINLMSEKAASIWHSFLPGMIRFRFNNGIDLPELYETIDLFFPIGSSFESVFEDAKKVKEIYEACEAEYLAEQLALHIDHANTEFVRNAMAGIDGQTGINGQADESGQTDKNQGEKPTGDIAQGRRPRL